MACRTPTRLQAIAVLAFLITVYYAIELFAMYVQTGSPVEQGYEWYNAEAEAARSFPDLKPMPMAEAMSRCRPQRHFNDSMFSFTRSTETKRILVYAADYDQIYGFPWIWETILSTKHSEADVWKGDAPPYVSSKVPTR